MGFIVATTAGLIVWIVLWALGAKSFDAFLITALIVMMACGARILAPYKPGGRSS